MGKLLDFLMRNPILALVALAWIGGIVGNMLKAAKKRQARTEAPLPRSSMPNEAPAPASAPARPSADAIAREMRRILGQQEAREESGRGEEPERRPPAPPPLPAPRRRAVVEPERPPTPVVPTTSTRKLAMHVDPHVGEALAQRHVRMTPASTGIGGLGGRTQHTQGAQLAANRFALDDLKRAFVLSEILGPPLASRPPREI